MIKIWDYLSEYEQHREAILAAVDETFRSGRLILADKVKKFEADFPAWCGARLGVGVNSATDALFLALKALGVGPGDEVITVANTAVPTVSAIVSAGGFPRYVDIDPATYLMDVTQLEAAITARTKVILPVHLYGQCVNMDAVRAIAAKHGLKVLEDCAQSTGALQNGRMSGSLGDVAAFSFYPTKVLGAYGDGGMVVTDDDEIARQVRLMRMYGMDGRYYSDRHGYNSRLDEVQAAILLVKMGFIDADIARRQELAARYNAALAGTGLVLPKVAPGNVHSYYVYVVRHPDRGRIMAELAKRDILVNISYPWPISTMKAYEDHGYKVGDLPVTEALAAEIFSLPMYATLSDADHQRVCAALIEILQ